VRIHAVCAVLAVVAGALLRLPPLGWGLLLLAIALVLVAELLNTALEAVVDFVCPHDHPLAKAAKDISAAAVLVSAGGAVAVGIALTAWAVSPH
jgi:undecaprenol kinase